MIGGEFYLSDALQIQIDRGARFRVQYVDVWQDTGKPDTTLQTNRYLLQHGHDNSADVDAPDGVIVPPVYVGPDVTLENAVVGPYANIVSGATIRNAVVRDSIIEADAVIEDVILEGSLVGEKAHVKGRPMRLNVGHSAAVGEDYTVTDSWL
jgi:glucose-1-phosphate thymidylyltransferase